MNKFAVILAFLSITIQLKSQTRQTTFSISELYPFVSGDVLQYQTQYAGKKQTALTFSENKDGLDAKIKVEELGSFNHQIQSFSSHKGLLLHEIQLNEGHKLVFNRPFTLLPAQIKIGQTYEFKGGFEYQSQGKVLQTGTQKVSIKVIGNSAAMTPLKNFTDCIVLIIETSRSYDNGKSITNVTKEWYAPEYGLVKMAGYATNNANDQKHKITMLLEKASIQSIPPDLNASLNEKVLAKLLP